MFQNSQNTAVFGGNFTEVHQGLNGRQMLSQSRYVVHGAIHDSGQRHPPSKCHPGTREDILKIALDWVNKPLDENKSDVFWLCGPAGVGKTAIAQSLCQLLKELGRLGGDFFFSRSVAGHSDLHTLFPTLGYQLAHAYPEFGLVLDTVIKDNESILTKNIELQLEHLIINPLKSVNKLDFPLVLVIDGLDEAGGESEQISLLRLLCSNFLNHSLPLKIFLTSRPEPWIKHAFGDTPLSSSSRRHFLHHTPHADNDIRTVLNSGFANIRKTHDLMKNCSDRWPSSKVIDSIVDRASGQFIFASTILRYVEDPNGNPIERLQRIFGMTSQRDHASTNSPFLDLDNLYKHVLSTSSSIDRTLAILALVVVIQDRSITRSFFLTRIERILNFRPGEGFLSLRTIQSLVDISSDGKHGVKFYHKSFRDFLLDSTRAGEYLVDINRAYSKIMIWVCRLLRDFEQSGSTSERMEIWKDLHVLLVARHQQWAICWLRSAVSDQDQLITAIKAIDESAFYWNYSKNIAQSCFFKNYLHNMESFVRPHCNGGNIAESILREISKRRTGILAFSLSIERFTAIMDVFDKHLNKTRNWYLGYTPESRR